MPLPPDKAPPALRDPISWALIAVILLAAVGTFYGCMGI